MSKISEDVEKFLSPIVSSLGYEIVDVEFAKKYNGDNLTIFIDKEGGIDINDCEKVHNAINDPLDELNPTNDKPYTLNVSSPGIDRPIVTDRDFKRNLGEMIEVKLFQMIQKKKTYIGTLTDFNENEIMLSYDGKEIKIDRKLISKATKYIDF